LSPNVVERLQAIRSIGEQQIDGFGRIVVNWHRQAEINPPSRELTKQLTANKSKPQPIMTEPAKTLAQAMVQRQLRRHLDRMMLDKVNELMRQQINRTKSISKSQLYRLRQSIQASLQTIQQDGSRVANERQMLKRVLDDIKERKSAERQFAKARIGKKPMLKWLSEIIKQPDFAFTVNEDEYPSLGTNVVAAVDVALIYEYNLRYLDAVLGRIVKAKREDN
jgi:hypothetical protein